MSETPMERTVHVLQAGIDRQNELLARIADALEHPPVAVPPGRCGEPSPEFLHADGPRLYCALLAGHVGWHKGGLAEWSGR